MFIQCNDIKQENLTKFSQIFKGISFEFCSEFQLYQHSYYGQISSKYYFTCDNLMLSNIMYHFLQIDYVRCSWWYDSFASQQNHFFAIIFRYPHLTVRIFFTQLFTVIMVPNFRHLKK